MEAAGGDWGPERTMPVRRGEDWPPTVPASGESSWLPGWCVSVHGQVCEGLRCKAVRVRACVCARVCLCVCVHACTRTCLYSFTSTSAGPLLATLSRGRPAPG